jgi:hypothetical protein
MGRYGANGRVTGLVKVRGMVADGQIKDFEGLIVTPCWRFEAIADFGGATLGNLHNIEL